MAKQFQELPLEMAINILSYLNLSEVVHLNTECVLFRKAIAVLTRAALVTTRSNIDKAVKNLWQNYFLAKKVESIVGYDILTKVLAMKYLQTEVEQLFTISWRYVNDLHAWSYLSRLISPVLEEIEMETENIINNQLTIKEIIPKHPKLNHFIHKYDNTIEARINTSKNNIYLKIIDMLSICPTANFQIIFNTFDGLVTNAQMNFQLRNVQYPIIMPRFDKADPNSKNERTLISYLRGYVRFSNIMYLNESLVSLKDVFRRQYRLLMLPSDIIVKPQQQKFEIKIKPTYMTVTDNGSNMKQYIFTKYVAYDTYTCGLLCNVTANCKSDLQPITFTQLCKNSVNRSDIKPFNYRNPRNLNKLDISILNEVWFPSRKVQETRWTYVSTLDKYYCFQIRHRLKNNIEER